MNERQGPKDNEFNVAAVIVWRALSVLCSATLHTCTYVLGYLQTIGWYRFGIQYRCVLECVGIRLLFVSCKVLALEVRVFLLFFFLWCGYIIQTQVTLLAIAMPAPVG